MMRKLLVGLILVGLWMSIAEAKGEKIFDLKEQYFSGTMIEKGKEGYGQENRYDIGKVIVATDTRFNSGSYMYGLFTVDLKKPLEDWNVNIKENIGAYHHHSTTIRLTSHSGNSYFISFNTVAFNDRKNDYIQINDKSFKIGHLHNKTYTVNIFTLNGKTVFSINGKKFLKIDANNFGNLEKVELELNNNIKYSNSHDKLLALDIYKAK